MRVLLGTRIFLVSSFSERAYVPNVSQIKLNNTKRIFRLSPNVFIHKNHIFFAVCTHLVWFRVFFLLQNTFAILEHFFARLYWRRHTVPVRQTITMRILYHRDHIIHVRVYYVFLSWRRVFIIRGFIRAYMPISNQVARLSYYVRWYTLTHFIVYCLYCFELFTFEMPDCITNTAFRWLGIVYVHVCVILHVLRRWLNLLWH